VTNPLVTLVTSTSMKATDAKELEMWIGTNDVDNKLSGPYPWIQPTSFTKCGILSNYNYYPVMTKTCNGQGTGIFLRPVNGASVSIVLTEVRVSIVRAPSLGVWCVPLKGESIVWSVLANTRDLTLDWAKRGDTMKASFATIQHAINRATDGDSIELGTGVYTPPTEIEVKYRSLLLLLLLLSNI
jgi:hypothetical protein